MVNTPVTPANVSFGEFELDAQAGELRRQGRRLKLQPQPFKLLMLLAARPGVLVTREEIRRELWAEGTFVDFDQAVNFAIRQIRDALGDPAGRPVYIETVPKRGYRFIAPVQPTPGAAGSRPHPVPIEGGTAIGLQKALWTNIAELRLAEERRRVMRRRLAIAAAVVLLLAAVVWLWTR